MSSWGVYIQNGNLEEIDSMGSQLSLQLGEAVHYPAYDKRLFECKCNVAFPYHMVKYAVSTGDWSQIREKHVHP